MEFSISNLETTLTQFYQTSTSTNPQALEWLEKAKNSSDAWLFVWDLLQPQKASEVQYFAATTLHSKIEKSLNELTPENILALREKLLYTIIAYSEGLKIVFHKLCISFSAYFLQLCPEKWPDALPSLLSTFSPENLPLVPEDKILKVLFKILTALSEEFLYMHLSQHHKGLLRHHLIGNTPLVTKLLEKIITSYSNQEVILEAIKCTSSWVTIGAPFTEYQPLANIVINLAFTTYKDHKKIFIEAIECLKVIIGLPENYKYPTYLLEILSKILPLGELIMNDLSLEETMHQELIGDVCSLLLAFGGTHSRQCLNWIKQEENSRQQVLSLVTFILRCSGARGFYPKDETYSRLTFGFWYVLQDEIVVSSAEDWELYMKYLGPIYEELVNVLITKAQLPSPELNFTSLELETFRCYRQDISDTLMYCHSILHERTICLIQSKLEKINLNESKWQELEACLFSLYSVSETVDLEENNFLPTLFQYIRSLPFQKLDPKVFSTALDTIGAYANWISTHSAALEHVLPLIILGLNVPETTSSATMALKDLARDCQYNIKPFSSLILDASQKALLAGRLKLNDSLRVMYIVGLLLSDLPLETIMHYLNLILTPYMDQLNSLANQQPSPQYRSSILFCLKMVGVLSANLNTKLEPGSDGAETTPPPPNDQPQPVLLILHKLLPVIKVISDNWSLDEEVMQFVFVVLKQSVTTLLEDSQPVITDILDVIVTNYRICPQPAALDLSKTLCTLFGKDEKYQVIMQTLTNELCAVAMAKVSSAQNLSDHSDLLEALFTFLAQIIKKIPKLIICTDTVSLFQCATIALAVPELPTVKAAASFLVNFILQSGDKGNLMNVVNACGQQLVFQIISCIAGKASRSNIEPLPSILQPLNRLYTENYSHWLRQSVTENICPRTSAHQRENFISMALANQKNKRLLQETVREFSFICRGIVGTEYAQSVTPHF